MDLQVARVLSVGDDLVADAARASFNRQAARYTTDENSRLINFLASADPAHWTPFGHVRISLAFGRNAMVEVPLRFPELMAGLELSSGENGLVITHSIWGWKNMLDAGVFDDRTREGIKDQLSRIPYLDAAREALGLPSGNWMDSALAKYSADDITLRITCPIVIARQLFKHTVGFVYSEASGRYIEYEGFHMPAAWCSRPANRKQGAGQPVGMLRHCVATGLTYMAYSISRMVYDFLQHGLGIAAEQARFCMPLATSTTFVVTGSKDAWRRVIKHRMHPDAQQEIQILAGMIYNTLEKDL